MAQKNKMSVEKKLNELEKQLDEIEFKASKEQEIMGEVRFETLSEMLQFVHNQGNVMDEMLEDMKSLNNDVMNDRIKKLQHFFSFLFNDSEFLEWLDTLKKEGLQVDSIMEMLVYYNIYKSDKGEEIDMDALYENFKNSIS